jgi:hypothetical protein
MKPQFVFDAGPLITSCKFNVKGRVVIDLFLDVCDIVIAPSVRNEVVIAGVRYADAKVAKDRLEDQKIRVAEPATDNALDAILALYDFGSGERESMLLVSESKESQFVLVVDDHLAYLACDRLQIPKCFLLDLVVRFCREKRIDTLTGRDIITTIASRYPHPFVQHTLLMLDRGGGD